MMKKNDGNMCLIGSVENQIIKMDKYFIYICHSLLLYTLQCGQTVGNCLKNSVIFS